MHVDSLGRRLPLIQQRFWFTLFKHFVVSKINERDYDSFLILFLVAAKLEQQYAILKFVCDTIYFKRETIFVFFMCAFKGKFTDSFKHLTFIAVKNKYSKRFTHIYK